MIEDYKLSNALWYLLWEENEATLFHALNSAITQVRFVGAGLFTGPV